MERKKPTQTVLINSPEEPLSEAAIVDATLDFANGSVFKIEGEKIPGAEPLVRPAVLFDSIPSQHETIRSALSRVRTEPGKLARELCGNRMNFSSNTHRIMQPHADGVTITYYETFHTAVGVAKQGLLILLDPGRGFGQKLCQCQYSKCGNFFLRIQPAGGGRPQDKYCTGQSRGDDGTLKSHRELGNNERGASRMQKLRSIPKRRRNTK